MSLHKDLLKQSRQLAMHEPRRPRQASLRRSVSTAYYALFHLLVDAACREVVSGGPEVEALRQQVGRACSHSDMKKACQAFARWNSGSPPRPLDGLLPESPDARVMTVADAFIELQQARHDADYDLSSRFSRTDVLAHVGLAESAFQEFHSMRRSEWQRRVFLMALVFHGRWKR
ncbi:hypothetical protein [Ectothiorhodospira mobilis]|uniref:hypothetical protein n=1 Tax=Ectothiorhodospira mobilis TaxID=195064 RepID=UPI001EE8499D|nr:hypothetical protein [Ectothiorhodospira mobilis]